MKQLSILKPNTIHTFSSPISSSLIRVGVIPDGHCFFHCLYYALSSSYRSSSTTDRIKYVMDEREKLADELTLDEVKLLGQGELFRMTFLFILRQILCTKNLPDWDYWDNTLLVKISNEWRNTCMVTLENFLPPIPDWQVLFHQIEQRVLELMKSKVKTEWVDDFSLQYISNKVKVNFSFIKAETRLPYRYLKDNKHDTNVIFCWIHEGHYELVGLLNEKKATYTFSSSHSLIQSIEMKTNEIEKNVL